jgi:2-methylisocitrate lyase-like PEP mutase family enzyme
MVRKGLPELLRGNDLPIVAPGAFDGLSAKIIAAAGFQAVYASGGAIARAAGYPDIGLLDLGEVADRISKIVEATALPVIADADTGFGGSANVQRMARLMEQMGVAAFHIEDQKFPKRCGYLDGKSLITTEEMCRKIRIAKDSVTKTLVIARTDAIDTESFSSAMDRLAAYHNAGADIIYAESIESVEQVERLATDLPGIKLIDMFAGGITPLVPVARLRELGYKLMIIPNDLQRSAIKAMQKTLDVIRRDGSSASVIGELATMKEREEILGTAKYLALDA